MNKKQKLNDLAIMLQCICQQQSLSKLHEIQRDTLVSTLNILGIEHTVGIEHSTFTVTLK